MALLSKAEHDYLTTSSATAELKTSGGYNRVIKARLRKKVRCFAREELPVPIEKELLLMVLLHRHHQLLVLQNSVTLQKIITSRSARSCDLQQDLQYMRAKKILSWFGGTENNIGSFEGLY